MRSLRDGRIAGTIPGTRSLSSGPRLATATGELRVVPVVRGRRPLWDLKHPTEGTGVIARSARTTALANPTLLGMVLFIASESVFFFSVVAAYVANREAGLADARQHLELGRTAIFSVALFASSGTMALAAGRRDVRWLAATFALGAIFLVGQGTEYARLLQSGIGPSSALFGSTFFTLTGCTAFTCSSVSLRSPRWPPRAPPPCRGGPDRVGAVSLYWHFVDAVWVVVFSVVYLGTFL